EQPADTRDTSRDGWKVNGKVAADTDAASAGKGPGGKEGGPVPGGKKEGPGPGGKFGEGKDEVVKKGPIDRAPRTEFVIYLYWIEPLTPEVGATNEEKK